MADDPRGSELCECHKFQFLKIQNGGHAVQLRRSYPIGPADVYKTISAVVAQLRPALQRCEWQRHDAWLCMLCTDGRAGGQGDQQWTLVDTDVRSVVHWCCWRWSERAKQACSVAGESVILCGYITWTAFQYTFLVLTSSVAFYNLIVRDYASPDRPSVCLSQASRLVCLKTVYSSSRWYSICILFKQKITLFP